MKTDRVYLQHILDATLKIESYVSVGKEIFMQEGHWQDAVIRQLEIIGEATKTVWTLLRWGRFRQNDPKRAASQLRCFLFHVR